jgi:hypothetical protein
MLAERRLVHSCEAGPPRGPGRRDPDTESARDICMEGANGSARCKCRDRNALPGDSLPIGHSAPWRLAKKVGEMQISSVSVSAPAGGPRNRPLAGF